MKKLLGDCLKRIEQLDGLRGIALALVVFQHLGETIGPALETGKFSVVFQHLYNSGWMGVEIFFVLSGFLITGNLLRIRTQERYWSIFYLKRLFRLVPVFLLVCIPVELFLLLAKRLTLSKAILLFSPFSNWLLMFDEHMGYLLHLWSLAIEEQFYALWPFAVRYVRGSRLLWLALFVSVGSAILYGIGAAARLSQDVLYHATPFRLFGIALGSSLAISLAVPKYRVRLKTYRSAIAWAGLSFLLAGAICGHGSFDRTTTASFICGTVGISLLTAMLIYWIIDGMTSSFVSRVLSTRSLLWLGQRSYALYLMHYPINAALRGVANHQTSLRPVVALSFACVGTVILSFFLAELSWRFIEAPSLRLGSRMTHRKEALLES